MVELILAPLLGGASAMLFTLGLRERRGQKALRRQLRRIAAHQVALIAPESVMREEGGSTAKTGRTRRLTRLLPQLANLQRWLSATGVRWGVAQFLLMSVCSGAALAMLANLILGMPAVTAAVAVGGGLLPTTLASRKRAQRVEKFNHQLPEALEMLVRAIRVGHPLTTALRVVAEEAPEPIASEFRRTSEEQRFGVTFEQSMTSMAERLGSTEARIVVAGMILQRQVGGNLPEFVENVVATIRERLVLQRQVQAQTSQGRMSGTVLTLLPIAMGAIITLVSPTYLGAMFESPVGRLLMGMSAVLLLMGHIWIQRIVKLRM